MNCETCNSLIVEYLDGALDGAELAAFEAALTACPECEELVLLARSAEEVLGDHGHLRLDSKRAASLHELVSAELGGAEVGAGPVGDPTRQVQPSKGGRVWLVLAAAVLCGAVAWSLVPRPTNNEALESAGAPQREQMAAFEEAEEEMSPADELLGHVTRPERLEPALAAEAEAPAEPAIELGERFEEEQALQRAPLGGPAATGHSLGDLVVGSSRVSNAGREASARSRGSRDDVDGLAGDHGARRGGSFGRLGSGSGVAAPSAALSAPAAEEAQDMAPLAQEPQMDELAAAPVRVAASPRPTSRPGATAPPAPSPSFAVGDRAELAPVEAEESVDEEYAPELDDVVAERRADVAPVARSAEEELSELRLRAREGATGRVHELSASLLAGSLSAEQRAEVYYLRGTVLSGSAAQAAFQRSISASPGSRWAGLSRARLEAARDERMAPTESD